MKASHAIAVRSLVLAGAVLLALSVATIARPSQFSTKSLSDHRIGKTKPELKAQMAFSGYVLQHFKEPAFHWRLLPRHATCWSHVPSVRLRRVCDQARLTELNQRYLFHRAKALYKQLYAPRPAAGGPSWLIGAFICIHGYEGAWNADTGNGYYGGLQMDLGFQSEYGAEFVKKWGTANNWPPWAQLAAAQRAHDGYNGYSARGFGPWPNTARMCGLL